jgi:hypothetical protein
MVQATGVNYNQRAESTLGYLWAEMSKHEVLHLLGRNPMAAVTGD